MQSQQQRFILYREERTRGYLGRGTREVCSQYTRCIFKGEDVRYTRRSAAETSSAGRRQCSGLRLIAVIAREFAPYFRRRG